MIVKLCGGQGNQMFQYAFGRSVAMKRNEELFFDKSALSPYKPDYLRHYELGAYDLPINFADPDGRFIYQEKSLLFDPHVYEQPAGTFFQGYWQNEKYLDSAYFYGGLCCPKAQPNQACRILSEYLARTKDTCFIGVRRGDYLWPERINYHGVMDMDYYHQAMQMLPGRTEYFIFTDDPEWCREHFRDPVVVVNGPEEKHWDIWLMSLCKNAIIANSTFHWWGAWLGADKSGGKIIAPKKWFAANVSNEIVPERWITL